MLPINIELSKVSIDYFQSVADEVGYRPCGYLWLHPADRFEAALKARDLQIKMGWPVEAWDIARLRSHVEFIDKTDDIAGALFSPRDGLVNPNLLKNHYRARAREKGAIFDDKTVCRRIEQESQSPVVVIAERTKSLLPHEAKAGLLDGSYVPSANAEQDSHQEVRYRAKRVVNCAGPWASEVAKMLGYHSPAQPVRRQVCIFDCREVDLTPYGMIVDTSGVYFHPEATNGLAGFCDPAEKPGFNFHYDGDTFFNDVIWPALYERSSRFEKLKHVTGWAGLYEVSPDDCGIIGRVQNGEAHPSGRIYEAHSFSGHGVMHSYAAGMILADEIIQGKPFTLDGVALNAERFSTGKLLREKMVI
jgi:glycine/D-amino acid oxidase-like deaminating enzyme